MKCLTIMQTYLYQDKSLDEVESRLWKIRASLPGSEWGEQRERGKPGRMDRGVEIMEEKMKEDIDIEERVFSQDEIAELMLQR